MLNISRLPQWLREVLITSSILGVHIIKPHDEVMGPIIHIKHTLERKTEEK